MNIRILGSVIAVLVGLAPFAANAQQSSSYPVKPLRIIVPGVPGAPPDIQVRRLSPRLAAALGQAVVVENRPGAAGLIAAQEVARSVPNGYTLLYGTNNDILREFGPNPRFLLTQSFSPVIRLASIPILVIVSPSIRAGSLREVIDLARAKPGVLTHAAAGPGSGAGLLGAWLKSMARIDMLEVHYKSLGAEINDLLSGQIALSFNFFDVVSPHSRSGKLKVLAVTSTKRLAVLPDVPTTAEAGLPGFEYAAFGGIFVPLGTPRPVIQQLHQQMANIISTPDFRDRVIATGGEVGGESPEELATFLRAESDKWGKVIKAYWVQTGIACACAISLQLTSQRPPWSRSADDRSCPSYDL